MSRPQQQLQRLKLPAYARPLLELRRKGLVPVEQISGLPPITAEISVSLDNWNWRKDRVRVVVAPDMDPAELDFRFVAGLSTLLAWWPDKTPWERCDATIRSILRGGPTRLVMVRSGEKPGFVIIKHSEQGIALPEFFA